MWVYLVISLISCGVNCLPYLQKKIMVILMMNAMVIKYFCACVQPQYRSNSSSSSSQQQHVEEEDIDPQQLALLEEPCILVDEADMPLGPASKRHCHLMRGGTSPLHRAFSVFLFNTAGELLVHRRSHTKVRVGWWWLMRSEGTVSFINIMVGVDSGL